jgi:ankyrin repeat protein
MYNWTRNASNTNFTHAVRKQDLASVKRLLESDRSLVDTMHPHHGSPLYIAAENGYLDIAHALIDADADVNKTLDGGYTPLYVAARKGYPEIVKLLLERGADVNKNTHGITPLYIAVSKDRVDIVRILVEQGGADVNSTDSSGMSVLDIACRDGNADMVDFLITHGADVNPTTGHAPLYIAAGYDNESIINALIAAGANVNAQSGTGSTPLHSAAGQGRIGVVNALIRAGANVNAEDNDGVTPLHALAALSDQYNPGNNRVAVIQTLVDNGANVNKETSAHISPLVEAVKHNNVDVILKLIDVGANITGDVWHTLFNHASAETVTTFIHRIEELGIDLTSLRNNVGQTILHEIARSSKLSDEERKRLISGTSKLKNTYGRTPVNYEAAAVKQRNAYRTRRTTGKRGGKRSSKRNTRRHHA